MGKGKDLMTVYLDDSRFMCGNVPCIGRNGALIGAEHGRNNRIVRLRTAY